MRKVMISALLAFVCSISVFAQKMPKAKRSNAGTAYIEQSFKTYDALQKKQHSLAELGYLEFESCELLARHLEEHGFTVERGVAGIPTAFKASRRAMLVWVYAPGFITIPSALPKADCILSTRSPS